MLFFLATLPQIGAAQDAQYWTYQYGTRANLLSGAVVGSVVDISAVYYNPGALALIDEPDLISATKVIELSNLILDPDVGVDVDLDNLRFDFAPGFIAGLLPFGFLGDNVLAYSFFTRHLFRAALDEVVVASLDLEPLQGDLFAFAGFERDMREDWFGLSWSSAFLGKFGIGVSNFFTYRNQKGSNRLQTQLLDETGGMALDLSEETYSYWDVRMLWKAGVTFDWLGASLGLTLTTPSLDLFGSGKVLVNRTVFNGDTVFIADFQDGLSPDYKSPWSAAFGGTYARGETTVHATAEYFAEVDRYNVLDPDPFVAQSTGDTLDVQITQALDNVLNFGVGVEHHFTPTFSGYTSFRTDFSAKQPSPEAQVAVSVWDIYFITAGAAFRVGTADLTFGASFGWGRQKDIELFQPGEDASPLISPTADITYNSLRLILALAI